MTCVNSEGKKLGKSEQSIYPNFKTTSTPTWITLSKLHYENYIIKSSKEIKKLNRGSKDYEKYIQIEKSKLNIQRFKGLGEMNPDELWNTTLNPETRNLLQVQYSKNLQKDQNLIKTLMGSDVASRKNFIVDNAINVLNLDI